MKITVEYNARYSAVRYDYAWKLSVFNKGVPNGPAMIIFVDNPRDSICIRRVV